MGCYKNNNQGRIHKIWSSEEKTCWKWSSDNWTKNKNLEESLKDNDDNQKWDQLYAYKEKMNELVKIKTKGAIIRSRQQWYEEGEKNSRYFFNLEKRNSNLKSINRLELNNNTITEDPKTILNEMKLYYKKIYTKTITDDPMTYLNKVQNINKLNDEDFISMNKEITEAELLTIVKSLPNNKTPGEDGLPSEFYKVFWQDIKYYSLESYKYSYQMGNLTITQKRGILCLTPKKSDPLKLKNWRPLSLLNQDYKILSKLVAKRMKIAYQK